MATQKKVAAATKFAAKVKPVISGKTNNVKNGSMTKAALKKGPVKVAALKKVETPVAASLKSAVKGEAKKVTVKSKKVQDETLIKKQSKQPIEKKAKLLSKEALPLTKQITQKPVAIKLAAEKAAKPALKPMAKKEDVKKSEEEKVAVVKPAAAVKAKDIKVPAPKAVVIPKISTKTVRKYQPDFTKSVLDKAERDPGAPTQRYSDSELVEFKELIQRKLEAAKKELFYLHGLITRKDELGGDEGDNRYMTMEDGSLSMEREQLSQMASRQITFIDHLEKAIMRIENKTYGICRVTGKLIDKARLRAVPHATLSIEAKMGAVK